MTDMKLAEALSEAVRDTIRALYVHETTPEVAGLAVKAWITPAARKQRLRALNNADAWPVTATSVTVSGWPYGRDVDKEAAKRIRGALADAGEHAAAAVLGDLTTWTVEESGPWSLLIRWDI